MTNPEEAATTLQKAVPTHASADETQATKSKPRRPWYYNPLFLALLPVGIAVLLEWPNRKSVPEPNPVDPLTAPPIDPGTVPPRVPEESLQTDPTPLQDQPIRVPIATQDSAHLVDPEAKSVPQEAPPTESDTNATEVAAEPAPPLQQAIRDEEREPNSASELANLLGTLATTNRTTISGTVGGDDATDWFQLPPRDGLKTLSISMSNVSKRRTQNAKTGRIDVLVNGERRVHIPWKKPGVDTHARPRSVHVAASDEVTIVVNSVEGHIGKYELRIRLDEG